MRLADLEAKRSWMQRLQTEDRWWSSDDRETTDAAEADGNDDDDDDDDDDGILVVENTMTPTPHEGCPYQTSADWSMTALTGLCRGCIQSGHDAADVESSPRWLLQTSSCLRLGRWSTLVRQIRAVLLRRPLTHDSSPVAPFPRRSTASLAGPAAQLVVSRRRKLAGCYGGVEQVRAAVHGDAATASSHQPSVNHRS